MKWIRAVSILAISLFTAFQAVAQVHVGVLGGMNASSLTISPDAGLEFSSRNAIGFGAVVAFNVGEMTSLLFEPMYLQKGGKTSYTADGFSVDFAFDADYLEIPILIKYNLGSAAVSPFLLMGSTVGLLLSAEQSVTTAGATTVTDIKDLINAFDLGATFGIGASLAIGRASFFIESRYSMGMMNINDDPDDPGTEVKNKGIQVFGGITFPLGGN